MDKKVLKNQFKKVIAVLLSISLCIPSFDIFRMQQDVHAAEIHTLQNPVIETDSSMTAGQKVTWDCIWFGSYPQSEVLTTTMEEPIDSKIQNGDDFIKDDALYQKLQNATTWDANGDTTIDGEKYRRIQKSDATYATTGSENYYNWSREGYHYFKYQPIKWQVLETKDGKVFLLSNDSLDDKRYHEKSEAVTWATSTIRSWLNGYSGSYNQLSIDYSSKNFIGTAFSTEEQRLIQSTNIKNDDNIEYGTEGGEDTNDKIFLLSESEVYTDNVIKYGFLSDDSTSDEAKRKKSSTFSKALGTWSNSNTEGNCLGNCWWWLRSPGKYTNYATNVDFHGWAYTYCNYVEFDNGGMCPALNLNLSSTNLYQYAGTVCSDGTVNEVAPVQTAEQETTTENVQTTISTSQLPTTAESYTTTPSTSTVSQSNQTTTADGSVQSVQMDNQSVAVVKGNTFFLTYQVTPANAVIHKVSWKSSNNNVVMVDSNGVAMAVGTGMATIAVIIDGKTATTAVTVVDIDNPETTTLASTTPASTTPASTMPVTTTPASTTPATAMPETTLPATSTTQGQTTVETSTTEAVTSVVASTSGTPATTEQNPTTEQPTTAQVTTMEPPLTTEQPTTTEPSPTTEQPTTAQVTTTEPPLTTEQPTTAQQPATPEQPITTGQPLTTMQMPTTTQPQTTTRRQVQPTATRPLAVNTTKKKQKISVKSSIEKTYSSKRFSMNAKTNGDGKLTYKSSNKKVAKVSSKGIVSMTGYGKTTITVSAPETNYYKAAKKKVTLMVRPVQGKIKQLKRYTDGMVKISWEKDKRATGYAIQISTDGKFKGKKMQRYFDKNSTSVSISLVKGKKYYIRIRNYKNGSGVYNFGSWSKVKIY